jgi:hypothetical protein
MGKLLKLGVLAGIAGGAVYAWKKMTGGADTYGDVAAGSEPSSPLGRRMPDEHRD